MRKAGIIILAGSLAAAALALTLWVAGLVTGSGGGLIHLLLVFALMVGPAGAALGVILILVGRGRGRERPV